MQRNIESGAFRKVGVNCYRNEEEDAHPVEFHPYNERRRPVAGRRRSNKVRAERDGTQVQRRAGAGARPTRGAGAT